jgi:sn-glycerol 3-phosphate transport system permease protein
MAPDEVAMPAVLEVDTGEQLTLTPRPRRPPRRSPRKAWRYVVLCIGALLILGPIYINVVDSLLLPSQLLSQPPTFFPTHPQWSNYTSAWTTYGMGGCLRNSAIMTMGIVIAQVTTSALAAYAFVFLRFPFRRTLFLLCLATLMIPFEVTVTANFHTIHAIGWNTNFGGLILPFVATGFGIFLLRQAFMGIPKELHEAATIDGYGPLRFFWRVALPLARPQLAALAVFSFLGAWNQYLWPSLLSPQNPGIKTAQVCLSGIASADTVGQLLASAVITIAPLAILLIFFQKNLIRSLTAGAVK